MSSLARSAINLTFAEVNVKQTSKNIDAGSKPPTASVGDDVTWQISESLADSQPGLIGFTSVLLVLLYGYEIFNFSLSIDEELVSDFTWWKMYIEHGSWSNGVLTRVLPTVGNVPMLATVIFCVGLGFSACVLARLFFVNQAAQFAFVSIFVSSPFWPHLAEFNISSWGTGFGLSLLALSLLLFYSNMRFRYLLAVLSLMIACGFAQTFAVLFLTAVCLHQLAVLIEASPIRSTKFVWVRGGFITAAALGGYLVVQLILLRVLSLRLVHVQMYFGPRRFMMSPGETTYTVIRSIGGVLSGVHPAFFGYGKLFVLLPLLGALLLLAKILYVAPLTRSKQILAVVLCVVVLLLGLSPIIVTGAVTPVRILYTLTPIYAFLTAVTFLTDSKLLKPLYLALGLTLFVSVWVSVSLFYTDHLVRQRDQVLAVRIMARVDQVVPNPQSRIPFVLVGAPPATSDGPFRKLEVFGDSYFDTNHEHGNPFRLAAYLKSLGIDTLEPHPFGDAARYRSTIEGMPVWPASGSIAIVNGFLVIKLGKTLPP